MKTSTRFFYAFLASIASFGLGVALGCDLCTCPGGLFILGGLLVGIISLPGWIIAGISEAVAAKNAKAVPAVKKKQ